jgi:hypothetical protein
VRSAQKSAQSAFVRHLLVPCCSIDRISLRLLPAEARMKPLLLIVAVLAAFIPLAWLTAPARCKPGDLGLFIGDMRIAGCRR